MKGKDLQKICEQYLDFLKKCGIEWTTLNVKNITS